MPTLSPVNAGASTRRLRSHHVLWIVLGILGLSVLAFTEYPIFLGSDPFHAREHLLRQIFLLVPHATGGVIATVLGPFLFSTRFRQRHLKRHRILGRIYVLAIACALPGAYLLRPNLANAVGALLWGACTFCAYRTARNRQIAVHRQWVVRSYLFTLNFIMTRIFNPFPIWARLTDGQFVAVLLTFHVAYLFLPSIYFNWRELTTRRNVA